MHEDIHVKKLYPIDTIEYIYIRAYKATVFKKRE
jgi:hypothetical protein